MGAVASCGKVHVDFHNTQKEKHEASNNGNLIIVKCICICSK